MKKKKESWTSSLVEREEYCISINRMKLIAFAILGSGDVVVWPFRTTAST